MICLLLMTAMQSLAGIVRTHPSWNITKGMLKEKVTGIAQDKRGFLWFSSWGGLFRYDEYSSLGIYSPVSQ